MDNKKLLFYGWTCSYIAAVCILVYLIGHLLVQYIHHGEQANQETQEVCADQKMQKIQTDQKAQEVRADQKMQKIQADQKAQEVRTDQKSQKVQMDQTAQTVQVSGGAETEYSLTESDSEEAERISPDIRVQILSQDYESKYHAEITVTSEVSYEVIWIDRDEKDTLVEVQRNDYMPGEIFSVNAEEEKPAQEICIQRKELYRSEEQTAEGQTAEGQTTEGQTAAGQTTLEQTASVQTISEQENGYFCITSFTRADGCPEYGGTLHLYWTEEGYMLINKLPLEEYLYSVVSSEIPSGYPIEAQKAQAVCARTYAWKCMERARQNGTMADLDDSVSWQVYNNYRSSENSRAAVDATAGEILEVEEALYYSTSCLSEQRDDLNSDEKFSAFLDKMPDEEAEYGSPWIRWKAAIDHQTILEQLAETYDCTAKQIDQIDVTERSGNGQVQKLRIVCGEQMIEVEGEYQIRNILSVKNSRIDLADGSVVEQMRMLPSAYFVLENERTDDRKVIEIEREIKGESEETDAEHAIGEETLVNPEKVVYISGGGYGHGTGMSQCGAAAMAQVGADYEEILQYYYDADLIF